MLFKNSARTTKRTPHFTITKINWLMLFKGIIAVYSKNNTKSIHTNCSATDYKPDGTYTYRSALKGYVIETLTKTSAVYVTFCM